MKVGLKRRSEHPDYDGTEEFNFFLSVLFPDEELMIMDYNRVVQDLNGYMPEEFLEEIGQCFEGRADSDMRIAFSMFPTSIHELFAVADANRLMPPKSTWFEPKLRSGLFIHRFER